MKGNKELHKTSYKAHGLNSRQVKYPEAIKSALINDAAMSWSEYLEYRDQCSSRQVKVRVICQDCGEERITNFKHLNKRKVFDSEQYCTKCGVEAIKRTPEFAKANSEAQLLVQGTPEQKKKNSEAVKKFWKENPEARAEMGRKISEFNQSERGRETIRNRPTYNGRGISGVMTTRFGKIQFDSCYELAFLDEMNCNPFVSNIERGEEISYHYDDKDRSYFMDFTVTFSDGRVGWYEIKSKYIGTKRHNFEKLKAKMKAAHAAALTKGATVFLVHEDNALKMIGREFPRGAQRKALISDLGSLVTLHHEKHRKEYQDGEIDLQDL